MRRSSWMPGVLVGNVASWPSRSFAGVTLPVVLALSLLDAGSPGLAEAPAVAGDPSPVREVVVSHADERGRLQLYRVNGDGTNRRRITDGTHDCSMPAWSPDGKKIVYVRRTRKGMDLWLSSADGKNARPLTETGRNIIPSWVPDSKHVVWTVTTPGEAPSAKSQVWLVNTETRQSRPLFSDPVQLKASNSMAVVSPDGQHVAFVSNRNGPYRIWVSRFDGSDAKPISTVRAADEPTLKLPIEQKVPCWSPDGKRIAHWEGVEMTHMSRFTGKKNPERDRLISGTWNVWVVGRDGRGKRKAGRGDDPTFSPDGFVTRAFPDPRKGGPKVMVETPSGWKELPIVPEKTPRYGRFAWKP